MTGWRFYEGEKIAEGLAAVRLLGGGRRYEVRTFGGRLDGEQPHVVLELIDGPRLSTLIHRYGVDLEELLPLALNLCAVLHYLAHSGVVHLDVKPANIIIGGEPRLIDLSIARRLEDLAALRNPVGTDAFMAPEQCDPPLFPRIGPASDVWGLGATLHTALTGRRPFADDGTRVMNDAGQTPGSVSESDASSDALGHRLTHGAHQTTRPAGPVVHVDGVRGRTRLALSTTSQRQRRELARRHRSGMPLSVAASPHADESASRATAGYSDSAVTGPWIMTRAVTSAMPTTPHRAVS